jgi:hypothetical protein
MYLLSILEIASLHISLTLWKRWEYIELESFESTKYCFPPIYPSYVGRRLVNLGLNGIALPPPARFRVPSGWRYKE